MRAAVIAVLSSLAGSAVAADQDPYAELLLSRAAAYAELHGDLTMTLSTMEPKDIESTCAAHTIFVDHDRPQLSITEYQLQGEVVALAVNDLVAINPLKDVDTSAVDAITYKIADSSTMFGDQAGGAHAQRAGWTVYSAAEIAELLGSLRHHCVRHVREITIRHYVTDLGIHGGGQVINEIAPATLSGDQTLRLIAGDREIWSIQCDMATGEFPGYVDAELPAMIQKHASNGQ